MLWAHVRDWFFQHGGAVAELENERAVVALALLVRAARLLQAMIAFAIGFGASRNVWAALGLLAIALVTSGWVALAALRAARMTGSLMLVDVLATLVILAGVPRVIGPLDLVTSFNWALPYAQSTALVIALGRDTRVSTGAALTGTVCLAFLVSVAVADPDTRLLRIATGDAVGIAAFFAAGAFGVRLVRRYSRQLDRAHAEATLRETEVAVLVERNREHRRLHDDAIQILERAAANVHSRSSDLRSQALDAALRLKAVVQGDFEEHGTLEAALCSLVEDFAWAGLRVVLQCDAVLPILPIEAVTALRDATREALTNVRKHAGVDEVLVGATRVGRWVELLIEDHGNGFDIRAPRSGFGLASSIEGRIAELGGVVELVSAPGDGTVIKLRVRC